MKRCLPGLTILLLAVFLGDWNIQAQEKKKRTGSVTGTVQSQKKSPNGKNVILGVQAQGEEKARSYFVMYDPKVKGPIQAVLEVVRMAGIGDVVQLEWVDTGEGYGITAFQILKKSGGKKE